MCGKEEEIWLFSRKSVKGTAGWYSHLRTALGQLANLFYTLQEEAAGAQAVSSFDTYLAPFVRRDNLSYTEVKQAVQEFVFDEPYYTNSTQLPVGYTVDIFEALELQEALQTEYTGGTVFFLGEQIDDPNTVKDLLQKVFARYRLPYFMVTPTFSVCEAHGYISGEHYHCPICGGMTEVWSRIVGYFRPVQNWNKCKRAEFQERQEFVYAAC